jgi:hypothetical protein
VADQGAPSTALASTAWVDQGVVACQQGSAVGAPTTDRAHSSTQGDPTTAPQAPLPPRGTTQGWLGHTPAREVVAAAAGVGVAGGDRTPMTPTPHTGVRGVTHPHGVAGGQEDHREGPMEAPMQDQQVRGVWLLSCGDTRGFVLLSVSQLLLWGLLVCTLGKARKLWSPQQQAFMHLTAV